MTLFTEIYSNELRSSLWNKPPKKVIMLLYMILPASILDLVTSWALNELTAYKNLMLRPLTDDEAQFKVWAQNFNDTEKKG